MMQVEVKKQGPNTDDSGTNPGLNQAEKGNPSMPNDEKETIGTEEIT